MSGQWIVKFSYYLEVNGKLHLDDLHFLPCDSLGQAMDYVKELLRANNRYQWTRVKQFPSVAGEELFASNVKDGTQRQIKIYFHEKNAAHIIQSWKESNDRENNSLPEIL